MRSLSAAGAAGGRWRWRPRRAPGRGGSGASQGSSWRPRFFFFLKGSPPAPRRPPPGGAHGFVFGILCQNKDAQLKELAKGSSRSSLARQRRRGSRKPSLLPQRRGPHAKGDDSGSSRLAKPTPSSRARADPTSSKSRARRSRGGTGRRAALLLSSMPCSLCSKQAEQGSKTLCFSMQCLLLEKRAETRVCVSQHRIPFKKKHRRSGHMRGSNQSRSTK